MLRLLNNSGTLLKLASISFSLYCQCLLHFIDNIYFEQKLFQFFRNGRSGTPKTEHSQLRPAWLLSSGVQSHRRIVYS